MLHFYYDLPVISYCAFVIFNNPDDTSTLVSNTDFDFRTTLSSSPWFLHPCFYLNTSVYVILITLQSCLREIQKPKPLGVQTNVGKRRNPT